MSLRLNKVGNYPQVLPSTATSAFFHFNGIGVDQPYIQTDSGTRIFAADQMCNRQFGAYNLAIAGDNNSVIGYVGQGGKSFRAGHKDFFAAGLLLDHIFDSDRLETSNLIGVNSSFWTVTPSTQTLPLIVGGIIWTNSNTTASTYKHGNINAYCLLQPTMEVRYNAGLLITTCTWDKQIAVNRHGYKHVYFAYFMTRGDINDNAADFQFKEVGMTANFSSLRGNRPVFDPVMV